MKTVPNHLQRYVVEQNYDRYTSEDQAVWRYIMRQLKSYLSQNAHPCYLDGLERTGLTTDTIPRIEVMNKKLQEFGWGAVPVSGFIPPAAFMEFQALGFLPIASDMRSIDHILYTPAPDIVHEAAGHAPILIDSKFAQYLKNYAEVASKAIISTEDLNLYEAIRVLSDIKEHPDSTADEIAGKEQALVDTIEGMTSVSEASLLSRMNWWTAEYGLIGDIEEPKIFGAGLLSSVGEAKECLSADVKKIPLTVGCIDYSYDITEPQPQLFVTPDFETLNKVLDDLANKMSFRKGGSFGLKLAKEAQTVNTVELDTGIQLSGKLVDYISDGENIYFIKFDGPSQISFKNKELDGHDLKYHSHGYSTPVGAFKASCDISEKNLNQKIELNYDSGINIKGTIINILTIENVDLLLSLSDCTVSLKDKVLFEPGWGTFDLALGQSIRSVFGGPADRAAYGEFETFVAKKVPPKKLTEQQLNMNDLYSRIKSLRDRVNASSNPTNETIQLIDEYRSQHPNNWLIGVELLELCHLFNVSIDVTSDLKKHLSQLKTLNSNAEKCIDDGIAISMVKI